MTADALADVSGFAVVAVGGYGRGELSPHSDVDLLVASNPSRSVTPAVVRGLLYPLWDAGFQVGHVVCTPRATIERAVADLHAATAVLDARLVAGDAEVFDEILDRRKRWLRKDARALAKRLIASHEDRRRVAERAGWVLSPDLKSDIGGLRDVHVAGWLAKISGSDEAPGVSDPADVLLAVREALHGEVSRKTDRLRIDLQPKVAARLGLATSDGVDSMMAAVHTAARAIEHASTLALETHQDVVFAGPRRSGTVRRLSAPVQVEDGRLTVAPETPYTPARALRLIAEQAASGRRIAPSALRWAARAFTTTTTHDWDERSRQTFLDLLQGPAVASALETIDQLNGWPVLLPEWVRVRARAQYDPYHRYTVDAHSYLTVASMVTALEEDPIARAAADEAGPLDTLRLAALMHDIGKGSGEDHAVAGERLARAACRRMGYPTAEVEEVAALVRWHLLLMDTATRRDLDDGRVIETVAERVGDGRLLRLLYVLSEADARATGPEAWTAWKAALLGELYRKVLVALETGRIPPRDDVTQRAREVEAFDPTLAGRVEDVLSRLPRSYLEATSIPEMADEIRLLLRPLQPGKVRSRVDDAGEPDQAVVTVAVPDRVGTLARTAGVLALNRLGVLRAQAFAAGAGLALQRFVVARPTDPAWVQALTSDLEAAYAGRLALDARLQVKISDYLASGWQPQVDVRVLQEASDRSTVIEVRGQDTLGLLYALTQALSELDLDIHVAKIDTLGARVVDVFYVRTMWATKLAPEQEAEVVRAIAHRVRRLATWV